MKMAKNRKKKIVIVGERNKDVFDDFIIMVAGGLGALGLQDFFDSNFKFSWGMFYKLAIAFGLIIFVSKFIRGTSDTKK